MRILSSLSLAAALALTGASAFAEEGAAAGADAPKADAPKAEAPKAKSVKGTVVSAAADKVVIKVKAEEKTFSVNEQTEVLIDGAKGSAADLKVEAMVKVVATGDVASKIETVKPKEPKAEKKEQKAEEAAH